MRLTIFVFFMTITVALADTNVNISFTQQHSRVGSKMTELQQDQAEQKATDFSGQYNDDKGNRFARIQVDDKSSKVEGDNSQNVFSDIKAKHDGTANYRSERVQSEEREGFFVSQKHPRTFYNSNREIYQINGQFRNLSPQDKQNMEFERYIQSYHSGPTVETVYESAKPEKQTSLEPSSVQERSQRVIKFEKQVTLPNKVDSVNPPADVIKPIVNNQPASPLHSVSSASSAMSSSAVPSVSSTGGNNFQVNLNQKHSSPEKDNFNFDVDYNKPNYNDPTFKYSEEPSDSHFYNQLPPSDENPHNGYGDNYNNIYNRQQIMEVYHPAEQRPVVTKTIQIAQPAIKAKKYEVRHPAIQKEFYDIEERVVIKPAGTVVVELERPSAKILKEETTLPLGHPHPAVAAQYMQNRNTQAFSNNIYSSGGSSSANHPNNQYVPHPTYSKNNLHDHNSIISSAASPTYDKTTKDVNAEGNPNKPFISENHYSVSPSLDSAKPLSREIVVITDGHGNQRQLSTEQFAYGHDDNNKSPIRTVYNHRNSYAYEDNTRTNSQSNVAPQSSSFPANNDNRENFSFDAEYISHSGNSNLRKENKPARLQEAPTERMVEQQPQPIIQHEHKIVLSPSQHNIYLSRNQELPKTKFLKETAEVHGIKPYLKNNQGPVVVYTPATKVSELNYVQRPEYNTPARVAQYHNTAQRNQLSTTDNRVQYSLPYAQMRHYIEEDQSQSDQPQLSHLTSQHKSEKLILEDKPMKEAEKSMQKEAQQAHIEIKIPNMSVHEEDKTIFVSSTIRPMMMNNGRDESHSSKLEISVTNNGEPKKEKNLTDDTDTNDQSNFHSYNKNIGEEDTDHLSDIKKNPNCDQTSKSEQSENYELAHESDISKKQKFLRIVEAKSAASPTNEAVPNAESAAVQSNIQPHNVDVNTKSSTGHISPAGSRVIASTAAPKESSPSESFHKRRIVVNHPFQTVREVVEHEPYTNYHEVQVHEPATPAHYHSANFYKSHGAFRQSDSLKLPAFYA